MDFVKIIFKITSTSNNLRKKETLLTQGENAGLKSEENIDLDVF